MSATNPRWIYMPPSKSSRRDLSWELWMMTVSPTDRRPCDEAQIRKVGDASYNLQVLRQARNERGMPNARCSLGFETLEQAMEAGEKLHAFVVDLVSRPILEVASGRELSSAPVQVHPNELVSLPANWRELALPLPVITTAAVGAMAALMREFLLEAAHECVRVEGEPYPHVSYRPGSGQELAVWAASGEWHARRSPSSETPLGHLAISVDSVLALAEMMAEAAHRGSGLPTDTAERRYYMTPDGIRFIEFDTVAPVVVHAEVSVEPERTPDIDWGTVPQQTLTLSFHQIDAQGSGDDDDDNELETEAELREAVTVFRETLDEISYLTKGEEMYWLEPSHVVDGVKRVIAERDAAYLKLAAALQGLAEWKVRARDCCSSEVRAKCTCCRRCGWPVPCAAVFDDSPCEGKCSCGTQEGD